MSTSPPRILEPASRRRLRAAALIVAIPLGIGACASPSVQAAFPIRVMIEFRAPVDGDAPELLSRLRGGAGVPIRHATPVSPKLQAYELACPADDRGCDAAIQSLRRDPAVLNVFHDQQRESHPTTP